MRRCGRRRVYSKHAASLRGRRGRRHDHHLRWVQLTYVAHREKKRSWLRRDVRVSRAQVGEGCDSHSSSPTEAFFSCAACVEFWAAFIIRMRRHTGPRC